MRASARYASTSSGPATRSGLGTLIGHRAVEVVVVSQVDPPEAALAEPPDDPVAADRPRVARRRTGPAGSGLRPPRRPGPPGPSRPPVGAAAVRSRSASRSAPRSRRGPVSSLSTDSSTGCTSSWSAIPVMHLPGHYPTIDASVPVASRAAWALGRWSCRARGPSRSCTTPQATPCASRGRLRPITGRGVGVA